MKRSLIILLVACGLSVLIFLFSDSVARRNQRFLINTVRNETMMETRHVTYLISGFLKERRKVLATMALWMNPFWIISPDAFREEITENIQKVLDQYPGFNSIHFLNRQGIVVWGVPLSKSLKGVNLFHDIACPRRYQALFQQALQKETTLLSPLRITEFDPQSGTLKKIQMLLIIAPVFRNETYLGSLMAIMRIDTIGRRFFSLSADEKVGLWGIVDEKAHLLYANTRQTELPDFLEKVIRKAGPSVYFYTGIAHKGQETSMENAYLVSWARLPVGLRNTWRIFHAVSLNRIASETQFWLGQIRDIAFVVIAIMVLTAIFMMVSLQRSEARLDTLNQKYRDLLDNLLVGTFTFDATTGKIDYINQRACEILGYKPEELIGKDRLAFAWEEEKDRIDQISGDRMRGVRGSERYRAHMVHRSGRIIDVEIFAAPVRGPRGKVQSVRVSFTDITRQLQMEREIQAHTQHLEELVQQRTRALEESEALYRGIFETSLAIIYIHQDDKFRLMNQTGMAFFGFESREEMLRTNVWDTVPEGERERRRRNARQRMAGKPVPNRYESLVLNKKGDIRVVECNFQRIQYQGKTAVLAILFDITEKKKLETEIVHAERLKSMGQLATGVAHDFNNILSAILGRVQLLKTDPGDSDKVRSCIHLVEQAVEQGINAIKRIQEITRVRQARWVPEPLPLHRLVEDAIEITRYSWKDQAQKQGKTIRIETDLKDVNRPLSSELREVFMNLIINAVDAMPKGGLLRIQTMGCILRTQQEGVRIVFEDTGEGISPEVLKHVLEPFYTTKGRQGTGLGLSIVSEVVGRLGGTVNIESRVGQGTRVILEIPWPTEDGTGKTSSSDGGSQHPGTPNGDGALLVVDDEPALTGIFVDLLTPRGWEVVTANSGEEALKFFLEEPDRFALILTDLGMPKMNGWEFIRRVREISEDIPIVLMTGWGLEISEEDRIKARVSEVIAKPLTVQTILETVARYIS